jgi:carbon monoxide dehydrogenase subunit G
MLAKVGPVSATFKGKIRLSDIVPPDSYKIAFDGQGGAAGFGKGQAAVALAGSSKDGVAGTQMKYDVDASVGGKLAQIGSRLIDGAASKIADDFFARFEARFTPVVADVAPVATPEQGLFARLLAWLRGLFK